MHPIEIRSITRKARPDSHLFEVRYDMEGARKSRLLYIPNYLEENHLRGFAIKNDSTVFASETIDADHIREIRRLQYDNDAYPPTDMVLVSEKDGL